MSDRGVCVDCDITLHPSSPWYWWPETDAPDSPVVYPLCQPCSDCRYFGWWPETLVSEQEMPPEQWENSRCGAEKGATPGGSTPRVTSKAYVGGPA